MLKKIMLVFFVILFSFFALTEQKIKGSDIIEQIDRGEDVIYKNCIITGDLSFISVNDTYLEKINRTSLFKKQKNYRSNINVNIKFEGCTFDQPVLAYLQKRGSNCIYNVTFFKDVYFNNCVFKKESAFKYVEFKSVSSFKGCVFNEEALFKYAKFLDKSDFSKIEFSSDANFKYTRFYQTVPFNQSTFKHEANFKYTKFKNGAHFDGVNFRDNVNMKYTKFEVGLVTFRGTTFEGDLNSKYCRINGRPLRAYLNSN